MSIRDLSKSPNLTANLFPNCRKGAWHALVGILMPEESFRCCIPRTILFTLVRNYCTIFKIFEFREKKNTKTDIFSNFAWSDLAIGRLLFRVNWRMAGAYSFWIFIVIFDFFADKNLFSQNSIFEKFLKLRFLTLCNFSCLDEEKRPRYNGGLDNCPLFWLVEVDRTHFSFSLAPNSVDHVD